MALLNEGVVFTVLVVVSSVVFSFVQEVNTKPDKVIAKKELKIVAFLVLRFRLNVQNIKTKDFQIFFSEKEQRKNKKAF